MNDSPVAELSLHLALYALMAVGGGVVLIAPEVRQFVVDQRHWLGNEQFAAAYALAQAAPGPNLLFVSLVGWLVAGWAGALGATAAVIVPSTVLTLLLVRWKSWQDGRIAAALRAAFAPMSVGLLAAAAWVFMQAGNVSWRADVLTVLAAVLVVRTRLNPVLLIGAGALAGLAGLL
ncbi:chromate transporter [Oxalobacteraceae bacterium OM1]|nr:chromate transporter [Oxalobacteraceae bacterium OM1]